MKSSTFLLIVMSLLTFTPALQANNDSVTVKVFNQIFPTYTMGPDDPNTYFKDFQIPGMNYFRGTRSVYPYTFVNDYRKGKTDVEYEVVRLENEFIYVDVIPQLRGRIQGAVDKRNNWDFLYYNHVIKPAEIAVRSAWISGGLEYNHPGGHGYTQFSKISYDILEGEDGSKTIVIAEIEPVRMMKWEFEIILRPGELFVETKGRFISIVPYRVPFVSSNNAAMHATDEMELIYPQETHASGHGFDHLQKWSEFSPDGSDWNWIKNIKTALSAFADGSGLLQDYWGTYSHDKGIDAGTVVVADHRVAPGKKFFTWGTHESGKQWDNFLSDNDGGYVELQQQAYFSNLGYGYAVLDPFEVKEFSIFWYPVMKTGGFVKASKEVVINFKRINETTIKLDIQPTMNIPDAEVSIYKNNEAAQNFLIDLRVGEVYHKELKISSSPDDTFEIKIIDGTHRELISYISTIDPVNREINRIPKKDIAEYSIDQLYAKAISNYHDPYGPDAETCIAEILKRDSLESRANRLQGTIYVKRGQYQDAIRFLNRSLINDHFENCSESWFLLGYSYLQLGNPERAHEYLVQSGRYRNELDQSLFYLAQVEIVKKNFHEALRILQQVPLSKSIHPDIYNLLAYASRQLGNKIMAESYLQNSFKTDPLNFVGYIEKLNLAEENKELVDKINFIFDRKDKLFIGSQNYLETAIFYMNLHDYEEAIHVLNIAEENNGSMGNLYPMLAYYKGYCLLKIGNREEGLNYYRLASGAEQTYVFPYRTTSIQVLESVIHNVPDDAVARMYYGDLLYYLRRHDEAIFAWEASNKIKPGNFRLSRNLAIANYVRTGNLDYTVRMLEESFAQSDKNLRIFSELEQLYILQRNVEKLEKHYDNNPELLELKGDYAQNAADFYIQTGRFEDAKKVLKNTYFSPAEKALGKPVRHTRYAEAYIGSGKDLLEQKNYKQAIEEFKMAYEYPEYLNEAKVNYPVTTRLDYYLGLAYKLDGQKKQAEKYFRQAIGQERDPLSVATIYKAKALRETGSVKDAEKTIQEMLKQLDKNDAANGSARNYYLRSLAYEFLGDIEKAEKFRKEALDKEYNVEMEARYESSFMNEKKFAIE